MPLTVNDIVTHRVRVLLRDVDAGGIQWKDSELIGWFNEACSEIVRYRPEAGSVTENHSLVPGAKQTIPSSGSLLLEVVCNQDPSNGNSLGRVVRSVDRQTLDHEDLNWMFSAPTDVVYRYVASLTDPRSSYVYPPSNGNASTGLLIVYASPPEPVTELTDDFPLPDMYAAVAVNYICYRAFKKIIESDDMQQRADHFLMLFNQQVGATDQVMETKHSKFRQPV